MNRPSFNGEGKFGIAGKFNAPARLELVPGILVWAGSLGVGWDRRIRDRVEAGFSDGPDGEDEFDAVIGLLAMTSVVTGSLPPGEAREDPAICTVEGWILGRPASSASKA